MHQNNIIFHSFKDRPQPILFFRVNHCAAASQAVKTRAESSSLPNQAHARTQRRSNQCPQWTSDDTYKLCSKHPIIHRVNPRVLPLLKCLLRCVPPCQCDGAVSNYSFENCVHSSDSSVTPKRISKNPLHCFDACNKRQGFLLTKCCDFHP